MKRNIMIKNIEMTRDAIHPKETRDMIKIIIDSRSHLCQIEIMGHHLIDCPAGIFSKIEKICFIEILKMRKKSKKFMILKSNFIYNLYIMYI